MHLTFYLNPYQFCVVRAAAHQLRQDKHQDLRQKMQSCFIRDSDSSPHTEVARVCVLSSSLVDDMTSSSEEDILMSLTYTGAVP
jgi:hypothetical protein